MQRDLVIDDRLSIPHGEIEFTFARSAGPGGQNVNKVNSKAVLRWRPGTSKALPEAVRQRLLQKVARRLTRDGDLVLACDTHREQGRNVGECLQRLRTLVAASVKPPKVRRKTKPTRGSVERRLKEKRAKAQRKANRRTPSDEG